MTKSTTMQSFERLHKIIIEYVCRQAGLDRALVDEAAAEEVRAAVESVFPLSSLARFLTLEADERLQQIEELARITLGICLYNRCDAELFCFQIRHERNRCSHTSSAGTRARAETRFPQ